MNGVCMCVYVWFWRTIPVCSHILPNYIKWNLLISLHLTKLWNLGNIQELSCGGSSIQRSHDKNWENSSVDRENNLFLCGCPNFQAPLLSIQDEDQLAPKMFGHITVNIMFGFIVVILTVCYCCVAMQWRHFTNVLLQIILVWHSKSRLDAHCYGLCRWGKF